MPRSEKPLTQLLIDLGQDEELARRFGENPTQVLRERGLERHPRLRGEVSQADLHAAIVEEHGPEEADASALALIPELPLPWILAASADEEPLGGGGGNVDRR